MKELVLTREQIHRGSLILVNKSHPLRKDGREDCVPFRSGGLLHAEAAACLEQALKAAGALDQVRLVSGYRDRKEQEQIFRDSLAENGREFTEQYVALPGCSEHETGLAADLGVAGGGGDFIRPEFPGDGAAGRFRRLAADYGFILRYPAGKETVTGIGQEPWHFRYVGTPHAALMEERGLCLEEYAKELEAYPWEGGGPLMGPDGTEIYYVAAGGAGKVSLEVPEHMRAEVSGDNRDGWILTFRRG